MGQYYEVIPDTGVINGVKENPTQRMDFAVVKVHDGLRWSGETGDFEVVLVILGGVCTIVAAGCSFGPIGKRRNVFGGKPYAVYAPPHANIELTGPSKGTAEIALCKVRSKPGVPAPDPFLIAPEEMEDVTLGAGNFKRYAWSILVFTDKPVHRIEIGESITPSGNWTTFPPHSHEFDPSGNPVKVVTEEFLFNRFDQAEGYGLLKHYTRDGSIDTVYTVTNNGLVKITKGFHPFVCAPGSTNWRLWFHGGERPNAPLIEPGVAWINKAVPLFREQGM
jgi:5-deoxy-glucuronate isomerase